jgi:hypothetical protein
MSTKLSALQTYMLLHDPMLAFEYMIGMGRNNFADEQIERIELAWRGIFMMDDSGRSTGKSHNLLGVGVIKLPLISDRAGLLLGMDKEIGSELFDEHIGQWLHGDGHLKAFIDVRRTDMEGRVPKTTYGRKVSFSPAFVMPGMSPRESRFMTMTPDLSRNGKKMQSWRFNMLHFNEWTSWPKPDIMAETIEPIATRTNFWFKRTVDFRAAMEKHMQEPLGALSDSKYAMAFALAENTAIRPWIDGSDPQPDLEIVRRFHLNFNYTYGFAYEHGVEHPQLKLPPVKTVDDVRRFFRLYLDGDPVLANQICYDGSAKRPSDECYHFKKFYQEMVDEVKHPLYNYYNMSIEDLDPKWDGIIYSSPVIKKFKESHLDEDYQRVYGGRWVEGYANKPYDPVEILRCMDSNMRPSLEANGQYIITIDSAKGTERMRSVGGTGRTQGMGQGDDAGGAVLKLGDGTPENPDVIQYIYIADDVRKDPMAYDVHQLAHHFRPEILALDPGGGGGDLADSLAKRKLSLSDGSIVDAVPIVPFDYELEIIDQIPVLHFISRGNKMIKNVHILADSQKDTWRSDDFLLNRIHETARLAFAKGLVRLPRIYPKVELNQMHNEGVISIEEMNAMLAMNRAINEIYAINYAMDTVSGNRVKTANGLNKYVSPKRKDLAYCIIYAIFMAHTYRKFKKLTQSEERIPLSIG